MMSRIRLALLATAVVLVVAACGGGTDADQPEDSGLPLNPAAACIETQPDCEDTLIDGEPLFVGDEPDAGQSPTSGDDGIIIGGGALAPGGGLSVADALDTDAVGVLAVQGFVVGDATSVYLCDALAESSPPQCGGASLELAGIDMIDPDELTEAQGVLWSDQPVTLFGEFVDGVFTATPFSQ